MKIDNGVPAAEGAKKRPKVMILGAGVGGLSCGRILARGGYDVTILEKTNLIGGLSVSKKYKDFIYDLGPHNIHTRYGHIVDFYKAHFPNLFEHNLTCHILKAKKFIEYPLRGVRVILSLKKIKIPFAILTFLLARVRFFLKPPTKDSSFEDWIRNRFGPILYNEYFKNYAAKVWGVSPDNIDKYVAEKRVPVISLSDLVKSVLFGREAKSDHEEQTAQNFYLKYGIGELIDFLTSDLEQHGGKILKESSIQSIEIQNSRAKSISYEYNGNTISTDFDYLINTIPIPDFMGYLKGASEQVVRSSKDLEYCATLLVYLEVKKRKVFPSASLYFSDGKTAISRAYDVGQYSDHMVPQDRTLICCEIPCSFGDDEWNREDTWLVEEAKKIFIANGLLEESEIFSGFVERISHSYPRFKLGFKKPLGDVRKYISSLNNVISFGRQGGFAYVNTDAVMHQAIAASMSVMMARPYGTNCTNLFNAYIAAN